MVAETLDDFFSDDSMPQTAVDEELFELCTEFENVLHRCIPREMMPLWVTDEKLKRPSELFAAEKTQTSSEYLELKFQKTASINRINSLLRKAAVVLVSLSDLNRAVAKQPKQKNEMDFPEKGCLSQFFCCTPKLQLTRYNKDGMSITAPSVIIDQEEQMLTSLWRKP